MSRKSGAKNSTSTVATALANRLRNHRERRNSIPSSCAEPQAATATNNHHLRLVISTHPRLALLPPFPPSASRRPSSASEMPSPLEMESPEAQGGVACTADCFSPHQEAAVNLLSPEFPCIHDSPSQDTPPASGCAVPSPNVRSRQRRLRKLLQGRRIVCRHTREAWVVFVPSPLPRHLSSPLPKTTRGARTCRPLPHARPRQRRLRKW